MRRLILFLLFLALLLGAAPTQARPAKEYRREGRQKIKTFRTPDKTTIITSDRRSSTRKEFLKPGKPPKPPGGGGGAGQVITITGVRRQPIHLSGVNGLTIRGSGVNPTLQGGSGDGLVLTNCTRVMVQGFKITGWPGRGVRLIQTNRTAHPSGTIILDGLNIVANTQQGILTNDTYGVTVRGCRIENTRVEHALYFSGRGTNLKVERCVFQSTGRSSLQFNAEGSGTLMQGTVQGTTISNSFAVSALSVNLLMQDCTISGTPKAVAADTFVAGKPSRVILKGCLVKGNIFTARGSTVVKQ